MIPAPRQPSVRTPGHRAAPLLAAVLGGLCVLLLVLVASGWGPLRSLDGAISRPVHRAAVGHPAVTRTARILSDWVWDPWTLRIVAALCVLWLLRRGARRLAVWAAGLCVGATVLQQVLKAAVGKERPVWPDPVDSAHFAAWPSGHALTATVVCGLLLWLLRLHGCSRALWRSALALCAVSVVGVGLTRIWLGVHWPSDVVGGWLLGALLVVVTALAHGRRDAGRAADRAS